MIFYSKMGPSKLTPIDDFDKINDLTIVSRTWHFDSKGEKKTLKNKNNQFKIMHYKEEFSIFGL